MKLHVGKTAVSTSHVAPSTCNLQAFIEIAQPGSGLPPAASNDDPVWMKAVGFQPCATIEMSSCFTSLGASITWTGNSGTLRVEN